MTQVSVGVIGVGRLGALHAKIYHEMPDVRLAGVCDINPDLAGSVAGTYQTSAFTRYQDLLSSVNAVSIATPTTLHAAIAVSCIKRGIHTLIEKPMTATVPQADRLLRLAESHRTIVQVGHVERFNPAVRMMQQLCRAPQFIEVHRLGPYPHRSTDIGVVLDLMIHDLDIVMALVRGRVKRVDAVGVNVLSSSEDIANVRLTFDTGAVANLTASRVTTDSLRKIRVFESNTYLSLDYVSRKLAVYQLSDGHIAHRTIDVEGQQPLQQELADFVDAVRSGTAPGILAAEARDALALAKRIERQIRRKHQ